MTITSHTTTTSLERADLLEILATRRQFLIRAVHGLNGEQAAARPTVSELCLGGLIKHVSRVEAGWGRFAEGDPSAVGGPKQWSDWDESDWAARAAEFRMEPGETLAGLLADYADVANRTEELVRTLPSLDDSYPLPPAPWFTAGAQRSVRQVFLHVAAETAQHAGHADIIRETIDGTKSMG
jgi:hypothetical protein